MKPDEAEAGTVVVIGHPANGRFAQKEPDGHWYRLVPGEAIDPEELRMALIVGGAR